MIRFSKKVFIFYPTRFVTSVLIGRLDLICAYWIPLQILVTSRNVENLNHGL